jgi:glucose 1-dehydrogenase
MRAVAVFPRRSELAIVEVPPPILKGDHDVLVRVREVGICGTDREICAFHYGTPPAGHEALILGHEAIGEVLEVGSSVSGFRSGDLVVMTVRRPCTDASCLGCRYGREDFCETHHFRERGIKEADGYMTDLIVEDEHYLVPLPERLADVGVLVEPLTIAAKASLELDAIRQRFPWQRTNVRGLVLGAGPIGMLAAMMLVSRGATTVLYSREPANTPRAELVRSFGAQYVSAQEIPLTELASRDAEFNIIVEAVGNARVAFESLRALAPNGIAVLSGIPSGQHPIDIDLDPIMRNIVLENQMVFGTVNASRAAFEEAVRELEQFMRRFPEAVSSLITERVGLEQAPELVRKPGGIKQVVAVAA